MFIFRNIYAPAGASQGDFEFLRHGGLTQIKDYRCGRRKLDETQPGRDAVEES
jgi:hypothetical protein